MESEPNDHVGSAQTIHYPIVINGTAAAEDADLFRFNVQAGRTLAFDIAAARNGSPLDPVWRFWTRPGERSLIATITTSKRMRILSLPFRGRELIWSVSHPATAAAQAARITGSSITDSAFPMYSIPAGGQRGANVRLMVRGSNLQRLDRVRLDTTELQTTVLDRIHWSLPSALIFRAT